jgi:hypothetical protein
VDSAPVFGECVVETLPLRDRWRQARHPALPERTIDLGTFHAVGRVAEGLADSLKPSGAIFVFAIEMAIRALP